MSAVLYISEGTLIRKRRDGQVEKTSSITFASSISSKGGALKASKTVIPFTVTASPSVTDYQTNYAFYGEHPTVKLKTIDGDGNYIERLEQAKFIMVDGLLDSIAWDLAGVNETGFIIIS
jgi:hypothetical protein